MKNLLIVDDHPIFRNGLRQALEEAGEFERIAEAGTGAEAMNALKGGDFDVAIVDMGLPDMNGMDILEAAARGAGSPRFFVLTMSADTTLARRALRAGASGVASKQIALPTLITALRLVALGELYVEGELLRDILTSNARSEYAHPEYRARVASLSDRERAVLDALVDGRNTKEIARSLGISQRTVENYQSAVYAKLEATTPCQLMRVALCAGVASLA